MLVGGNRVLAIGKRRAAAGHHVVVAGHVAVIGVRMAANDRELVGDLRALAAMLGEDRTGDGSADRRKRPANLLGGIGLGVPHILLRRTTFVKDEDAGLGLRFGKRSAGCLRLQQLRQGQSRKQARAAEAEHVATGESVAEARVLGADADVEHMGHSPRTG
jgi:hypothetical protein